MIRKAGKFARWTLIAVLTIGTLGTAFAWFASSVWPLPAMWAGAGLFLLDIERSVTDAPMAPHLRLRPCFGSELHMFVESGWGTLAWITLIDRRRTAYDGYWHWGPIHVAAGEISALHRASHEGQSNDYVVYWAGQHPTPEHFSFLRSRSMFCYRARVSAWLVLLVLGAYPILALIRGPRRRRRRRRRGLCVACGYNLKRLPEPRCPECGRAFVRPVVE